MIRARKARISCLPITGGTWLMVIIMAMVVFPVNAQRGGESIYGILTIVQSARIASLGGNQVAIDGTDLSMLTHNPAILNPSLSGNVSLSYVPYMVGINYGFGGVARDFGGIGTFALGFHHLGYGTFAGRDETGQATGTFSAGETVIQLTFSRSLLENVSGGITVKPVFSRIESYHSWGIVMDAGLFYRHPGGLTTAGLAIRNLGRQLTPYHGNTRENIAPDLQLGVSRRLEHAPFRFSLTVQDFLSGSLDYQLPGQDNGLNGSPGAGIERNFFDSAIKHFTFGMEFIPTRNFYVAVGLNPRRRHELKIPNRMSTVGYTWGFGFRALGLNFSYGSARYHLGGTSNHFSISTNLSTL